MIPLFNSQLLWNRIITICKTRTISHSLQKSTTNIQELLFMHGCEFLTCSAWLCSHTSGFCYSTTLFYIVIHSFICSFFHKHFILLRVTIHREPSLGMLRWECSMDEMPVQHKALHTCSHLGAIYWHIFERKLENPNEACVDSNLSTWQEPEGWLRKTP